MTLGEYINGYLTENNMSMRAFAAISGVSHTYISYIVNGKTSRGQAPVPTIDKYRKIAAAMGLDVNELIAKVDDSVAWGKGGTSAAIEALIALAPTAAEVQLIEDFRCASDEIRGAAVAMLRASAEARREDVSFMTSKAG